MAKREVGEGNSIRMVKAGEAATNRAGIWPRIPLL